MPHIHLSTFRSVIHLMHVTTLWIRPQQWGKWGTERLSNCPRVTQLGSGSQDLNPDWLSPEPLCSAWPCFSFLLGSLVLSWRQHFRALWWSGVYCRQLVIPESKTSWEFGKTSVHTAETLQTQQEKANRFLNMPLIFLWFVLYLGKTHLLFPCQMCFLKLWVPTSMRMPERVV